MKLALLSARSDIHTVRWVNALADRGHDVHLFTMYPGGDPLRAELGNAGRRHVLDHYE